MRHKSFLWPDHAISKAESRRIREEHNAAINDMSELLEALDDCITNENATCIVQNDVAYMIRRFKAINQICRAAIAKATAE